MAMLPNAKHERFAQLVAGGANKTDAAKSLGYSTSRAASTGCNLAKDRNIAARIAELSARASEQAICSVAVDRAWVLMRLRENVERAMQIQAVTDSKGKETGEYKYDGSVANRALELLGKELGLFRDQSDHTIKWDGDISKLTNAQLQVMMTALAASAFGEDAEALEAAKAEAVQGLVQ